MNVLNKMSDIMFWFKYRFHPKHKYHLVDTKLGYGYWDTKDRMFHANFELLVHYIEECLDMDYECEFFEKYKKGFATLDMWIEDCLYGTYVTDDTKKTAQKYQTLKDLYIWYKFERENNIQNITKQSDEFNQYLIKKYENKNILYDIAIGRCLYNDDSQYIDKKDIKTYMKIVKEEGYLETLANQIDMKKLKQLIDCWDVLAGL